MRSCHTTPFRSGLPLVIAIAAWLSASPRTSAYTPDSPAVQAMVKRAVRYLDPDKIYDEGHRALTALALYKAGEDPSHPIILEAIKDCQELCRDSKLIALNLDIYETSVVGLFLSELDPSRFKSEIAMVVKSLQERQKPAGGWGYPKGQTHGETCDTSMTQYAVLCAWLTGSVGAAELPDESLKRVTNWLIRTQDPGGAWGYQGNDPGEGSSQRVAQTEVRHSLCVAGLGSMYILSGMLGITATDGLVVTDEEIPSALKLITETISAAPTVTGIVNVDMVARSLRDGNRWYETNYRINPEEYTMYYLYTLERYQSFREAAEGRFQKEPKWYNDGVNFLRQHQEADGSWDLPKGTSRIADTAFGVLFLMRSAQKTIAKANDELNGLLTAGRGLPTNPADVRMKAGKIVTTPFQGTADALLEILSSVDHPDFEAAAQNDVVPLSNDLSERERQVARMRRLLRAESYEARMVAIKTLATDRDLDNAPWLIYALSDPDLRVMKGARDGLRFLSRKIDGMGLSDTPTKEEREVAIQGWKDWLLTVRPEAKFVQ